MTEPTSPGAGISMSDELSRRRTGMSFQRTRLSADRTLMSVMRTSLSLISFGFTIYKGFQKAVEAGVLSRTVAPRNFGAALVALGIGMLILGIAYHVQFMLELRKTRAEMRLEGLIRGESGFPASLTLITAVLLLAIGVVAVLGIVFDIGPF